MIERKWLNKSNIFFLIWSTDFHGGEGRVYGLLYYIMIIYYYIGIT